MTNNNPQKDTDKINIMINSSSYLGSQYSQLVGVSVTDYETTLEFVYLNPRIKNQASVVSRVTLPNNIAKELSIKINETIKEYESATSKKA